MRLDRKSGLRGRFYRENGERVPWVIWYDTETHDWEAWERDPEAAQKEGVPDSIIRLWRYRGRCPLRFEADPVMTEIAAANAPKQLSPAPASVVLPNLPRRGGVFIPPGTGEEECEEFGCHRRAEWYTHDTEEVEVVAGFRRTAAVRRHYYCDRHYRSPVRESLRGVESEVKFVTARPQ